MKVTNSKVFWSIVMSTNITSLMICAFTGNTIGVVFSASAALASYYVIISQKSE